MQYFDTDNSGTVSRSELNEGFKKMHVVLNEALIKNLFSILDQNNDDEISVSEFEAVFAQALGPKVEEEEYDYEQEAEALADVKKEQIKELNKDPESADDNMLDTKSME